MGFHRLRHVSKTAAKDASSICWCSTYPERSLLGILGKDVLLWGLRESIMAGLVDPKHEQWPRPSHGPVEWSTGFELGSPARLPSLSPAGRAEDTSSSFFGDLLQQRSTGPAGDDPKPPRQKSAHGSAAAEPAVLAAALDGAQALRPYLSAIEKVASMLELAQEKHETSLLNSIAELALQTTDGVLAAKTPTEQHTLLDEHRDQLFRSLQMHAAESQRVRRRGVAKITELVERFASEFSGASLPPVCLPACLSVCFACCRLSSSAHLSLT